MCDEIQGFYFYRPMMPDSIKDIIYNQMTIDNSQMSEVIQNK